MSFFLPMIHNKVKLGTVPHQGYLTTPFCLSARGIKLQMRFHCPAASLIHSLIVLVTYGCIPL